MSENAESALTNKGNEVRLDQVADEKKFAVQLERQDDELTKILSIDDVANNKRFKVVIQTQHEDETASTIKINEKEAISNLWRQNISFGLTVAAIVFMMSLAVWIAFFSANPDPEAKKWASAILQSLIALVAGKIGFDIRKTVSK